MAKKEPCKKNVKITLKKEKYQTNRNVEKESKQFDKIRIKVQL
jgi:hypothetical protein